MSTDDFDITGARVLITGSSRGLGEGIASYFVRHGARVILHGRDEQRLNALRKRLSDEGAHVHTVIGETRDQDSVTSFVEEAARAFDGLDGLINNAGGTFAAPAVKISANGFSSIVATNLVAPFLVSKAALPYLERQHGAIVNIGSVVALRPSPDFSHYAAAKAGLVSLTRSLAAEWGSRGVRVNAVLPGLMGTDSALSSLFDNDPRLIEESSRKIGVGRLGTPDDLAMACRYLLSKASAFVNGEALVLDGGPPYAHAF
ncbi:MAG: SDR family NAD(P)-dependent oxidoreductase [Actinomycetota bacterium]